MRRWCRSSSVQAVGQVADNTVFTLVMVAIDVRLVGEQRRLPEHEQ